MRQNPLPDGRGSWTIAGLMFCQALCAAAADLPLTVEPAPTSPNVRLGKPMPTLWDVSKLRPGLLEGRLEFRVHLEEQEFYVYTTDELVLHAPEQRLRFLFPAVTANVETPELEVDITWLDKSGRVPLKMQLIRVPFTAQKTLLMAVGEERSGHGRTPEWDARLQSLTVESLTSESVRDQLQGLKALLPVQTVVHSWDAGLFPNEPYTYAAYDAVAIRDDIFRGLRRPQLDALETWVRAGGQLYLEPDGLLEPLHVDFLNRLTDRERSPTRWSLDRRGRLEWPDDTDDEWPVVVDLGRTLFRRPSLSRDAVTESSLRFLWDIPPGVDPTRELLVLQNRYWQTGNFTGRTGRTPAAYQRPPLFDTLQAWLMPSGVQVVPVWLIALLLGGLVIAIGPGEWWLLGKLRLRRFTWLTWPAATLAVTAATVALSNWYMASAEQAHFLQLVDLGEDGRPVRTNRFELTFPSRSRVVTDDVERGLWRVIEPPQQTSSVPGFLIGSRRPSQGLSPADNRGAAKLSPLAFAGRVPNRYATTQTVPQWTPRITQRFSFAADDEPPADWPALDVNQELTAAALSDYARQLTPRFGATPLLMLVAGQGPATFSGWPTDGRDRSYELLDLLRRLTVQDASHGTEFWSQPDDRGGWLDLPILSASRPDNRALLVIIRDGRGWIVYRWPLRNT